jgi:hypothetical protein
MVVVMVVSLVGWRGVRGWFGRVQLSGGLQRICMAETHGCYRSGTTLQHNVSKIVSSKTMVTTLRLRRPSVHNGIVRPMNDTEKDMHVTNRELGCLVGGSNCRLLAA